MYKRIITVLLLLGLLSPSLLVNGADNKISFEQNVIISGNELVYTIDISENSNIAALSFTVNYNAAQVQLKSVTEGDVLKSNMTTVNSQKQNRIIVSSISMVGIKTKGNLLKAEFLIVSSKEKQIDIKLSITECVDSNSDGLAYTKNNLMIINPLYLSSSDIGVENLNVMSCTCICHSINPFSKIIWFIEKLLWRIMGINQVCVCGAKHY